MQVNGFARMALGLAFVGIFLMGGCRSTTDRMRVLEAEKADADMRNKELVDEVATLRAKAVQDQAELERQRVRADAADARAVAAQRRNDWIGIDPDKFRGDGVEVKPNDDGGATIILASDVTFKAGRADPGRYCLLQPDRPEGDPAGQDRHRLRYGHTVHQREDLLQVPDSRRLAGSRIKTDG